MDKENKIIITEDGTYVEIRGEIGKCCVCKERSYTFLNGLNVCILCAGLVPSYIPGNQCERYMKEWIKK